MRHFATVIAFTLLLPSSVLATGFWDEGISDGSTRTDFVWPIDQGVDCPDSTDGHFGLQMDVDPLNTASPKCRFAPSGITIGVEDCGAIRTADWNDYTCSNRRWVSWTSGTSNYWSIHANNEPIGFGGSLSSADCSSGETCSNKHPNSGPPGQSLPIGNQGDSGVFRLWMPTDPAGSKDVVIAVDNSTNPIPGGIPFLGWGAHANAGNGGPIGPVGDPNTHTLITLKARKDTHHADSNEFVDLLVQFYSEWGNPSTPRAIQIDLFKAGGLDNGVTTTLHRRWNWPFTNSYFNPGADFVFMSLSYVQNTCHLSVNGYSGANFETRTNTFDATKLFQCAASHGLFDDNSIPSSAQLKGFFTASEVSNDDAALRLRIKNVTSIIQ